MTKNIVFLAALAALAHAQAPAPAPVKIATIHVQNAIMSTQDGQKAAQALQTKFTPRKQVLDKKQSDLQAMQSQLRAGTATMSQAAKDKLNRDIDTGTKALQRDSEDFQSEVQAAEGQIMSDLGQKVMEVIQKFTSQNGIALVVDVSNPQSPVLWADASIDITNEIVKQYDQAHPAAPPPAAPAAAKPAAAPPAAPVTKKQ
ncbi:MAG TPA: OmpH family outer membrane protein [Bryobacteraceae bacterium]|nr:OmpH family outer membrane protein [Bryobacteraceae bacterium]